MDADLRSLLTQGSGDEAIPRDVLQPLKLSLKWRTGSLIAAGKKEKAMRAKDILLTVLVILAPLSAGAGEGPCVEVEIGDDKAPTYRCLNQGLQSAVDAVKPTVNLPPADAASPAVKLGGFNQQALKQQYGPNFGTSAVPYRPSQTYHRTP